MPTVYIRTPTVVHIRAHTIHTRTYMNTYIHKCVLTLRTTYPLSGLYVSGVSLICIHGRTRGSAKRRRVGKEKTNKSDVTKIEYYDSFKFIHTNRCWSFWFDPKYCIHYYYDYDHIVSYHFISIHIQHTTHVHPYSAINLLFWNIWFILDAQ